MASCQGPCAAALCLTMHQGLCSASPWTMKRLQLWPLLTGRPWSRSWRWPGSRTTKLLPTEWRYALFPLEICVMCTAHTSHLTFTPTSTLSKGNVRSIGGSSRPVDFLNRIVCTDLCDAWLLWPSAVASCTQLPLEKCLLYHNYSGLLLLC